MICSGTSLTLPNPPVNDVNTAERHHRREARVGRRVIVMLQSSIFKDHPSARIVFKHSLKRTCEFLQKQQSLQPFSLPTKTLHTNNKSQAIYSMFYLVQYSTEVKVCSRILNSASPFPSRISKMQTKKKASVSISSH